MSTAWTESSMATRIAPSAEVQTVLGFFLPVAAGAGAGVGVHIRKSGQPWWVDDETNPEQGPLSWSAKFIVNAEHIIIAKFPTGLHQRTEGSIVYHELGHGFKHPRASSSVNSCAKVLHQLATPE